MAIEFPEQPKTTKKLMYRIVAQTDIITMTGMTTKPQTFEEVEKDAALFCSTPTKPYVITPICNQEQWDAGYICFCPRCGHKLDMPIANYDKIECDDCHFKAYIDVLFHSELVAEPKVESVDVATTETEYNKDSDTN